MEPDTKKLELFIGHEKVAKRIAELSIEISKDFHGRPLVIIGVLKSAFIFLADIVRNLTIPAHIDFISVSSYEGTSANDDVIHHFGPFYDLNGKNVLIVEDIIDTGSTIDTIVKKIKESGALDIKILALLNKEREKKTLIKPDYVGFNVKDGFLVGYGLDLDEEYRTLKDIYKLKDGE